MTHFFKIPIFSFVLRLKYLYVIKTCSVSTFAPDFHITDPGSDTFWDLSSIVGLMTLLFVMKKVTVCQFHTFLIFHVGLHQNHILIYRNKYLFRDKVKVLNTHY